MRLFISLPLIVFFAFLCGSSSPARATEKGSEMSYALADGKFSNITEYKRPNLGLWEGIKITSMVFLNTAERRPKGKIPEVKPDLSLFLSPPNDMAFIWLGHSSLLLHIEGKTVLIDPVFSEAASFSRFINKRFQPPVLNIDELPAIDAIVISHDHYDHLDKETVLFFKDKPTLFIAPLRVGRHLRRWGISEDKIQELDWHASLSVKGLVFTAAPAVHFSGRTPFSRNETLWASWIIHGQKTKIFYSSDTGYGPHFKEIARRHGPFNLAFMECGQYNWRWPYSHMTPEESLQAMRDIGANLSMPVHWGMFTISMHPWDEPAERIFALASEAKTPLVMPRLGEVIVPSAPPPLTPWWREKTER